MNWKFLTFVFALGVVVFGSGKSLACPCQPPIACFTVAPSYADVCGEIAFDATYSYDPDGTTLTYSWDFGDGTYGSGKTVTHCYTCTGTGTKTVKLTVTDNDDPECCGGQPNCNDKSDDDYDVIAISLPSGCSDCSGDPVISLEIVAIPTTDDECCGLMEPCGCVPEKIEDIDTNIATPCYSDCKWRFGVTATADLPFGPCTDNGSYDNYTEVCGGGDPGLTEDNYCDIAADYDYDPEDVFPYETGIGCVDSGGTRYSCTDCVWEHELQHVEDYNNDLREAEALLPEDPALQDMAIDCEDSNTVTCNAAKSAREATIIEAVKEAYESCMGCDEVAARETAHDCFYSAHASICLLGILLGWEYCEDCQ